MRLTLNLLFAACYLAALVLGHLAIAALIAFVWIVGAVVDFVREDRRF